MKIPMLTHRERCVLYLIAKGHGYCVNAIMSKAAIKRLEGKWLITKDDYRLHLTPKSYRALGWEPQPKRYLSSDGQSSSQHIWVPGPDFDHTLYK